MDGLMHHRDRLDAGTAAAEPLRQPGGQVLHLADLVPGRPGEPPRGQQLHREN
jgi:hypothetical protein